MLGRLCFELGIPLSPCQSDPTTSSLARRKLEIPGLCIECHEIEKSFEVMVQGAAGNQTYRVDVLRDIKHEEEKKPYSARFYRVSQNGPLIHVGDKTWVDQATAYDAANAAIDWLTRGLGKP